MSSYKYFGIMIDDKLAWHDHIDYFFKRLNVRMYFFRKLNYFRVDKRILALLYESIVATVWRYCLLCWGEPQQNLENVYADLLITKLTNVMDDASHPLHNRLAGQLISRSGRMRLPSAVTGLISILCSTGNQNLQCKLSETDNFH